MRTMRFRLTTLMIFIAITALTTYGVKMHFKRMEYYKMAKRHAASATAANEVIISLKRRRDPTFRDYESFRGYESTASYHLQMFRFYEFAASHPWESLPSRPPVPDDYQMVVLWCSEASR